MDNQLLPEDASRTFNPNSGASSDTSSLSGQTPAPITPIPTQASASPIPASPSPSLLSNTIRKKHVRRYALIGLGVGAVLVGGVFWLAQSAKFSKITSGNATERFATQPLSLDGTGQLAAALQSPDGRTIQTNGQLKINGSLVVTPSSQPTNATAGQLFYDKTSNQLTYYNGQQFVSVGGSSSTSSSNSFTNITNVAGSGTSAVQLQSTSPSTQQTGGFSVSGTGVVGALQTGTIQSGANNLSLSTGSATGTTASISLATGNSSTTASGNVNVDTGSGIVDGTIVNNKTFESGTEHMDPWTGVGCTTAQSFAQARTGAASLAMTGSTFCGTLENNNFPVTPVVPGHSYFFSAWVRADTTGATINGFVDILGTSFPLTSVTDTTTGWTQMTGQAIAPPGSTFAFWSFGFTQSTVQTHYFDDVVTTDLSSASAISQINIGTTNAQFVNIGNANQLGATKVVGSGLTLNGGVGTIAINGGSVNINGSASSTLATSAGALTLTSAATASWGVGTAANGNGDNLTLHAGNGTSGGNNNGGNLLLQGGTAAGTGIGGSVIVKPQTDSSTAFQIQNSAGTPLLLADSTNMRLTVAGTSTTFALLTLANAHFSSTQTNAPTVGTPATCGTAPTAAVAVGSTDSAGSFTITTGTGGSATTCDTTVTFTKPYNATPKSIIVVGKTDAASAQRQVYVSAQTSTTFTVSFAASAAGADNTAYNFSYWIVE